MVVFVGKPLSIVLPNPLGKSRGRLARIDLDLIPISLLQKLGVGKADLLRAGRAGEFQMLVSGDVLFRWSWEDSPQGFVHVDCLSDVFFASDLET